MMFQLSGFYYTRLLTIPPNTGMVVPNPAHSYMGASILVESL